MGQHMGSRLVVHLQDVLDHFELSDSGMLGITTDNASSNDSKNHEPHSTVEASGIKWPALRNHIL